MQSYHKDILTKKIKEHQVPPPPPPTPEEGGVPEELEELRREEEMLGLPLSSSAATSDPDLSKPSEGSTEVEQSSESERREDGEGVSRSGGEERDIDSSAEDKGDQTRSPAVLRGSSSETLDMRLATLANTAEESAQ